MPVRHHQVRPAVLIDVEKRNAPAQQQIPAKPCRLRDILEKMPVGVMVANPSGAIEQMNLEARRIWGGQSPVPAHHYNEYKVRRGWWLPDNRPVEPHEWAIARAIEKNETTLCEVVQIQCLDGSKKIVLSAATPIDHEGALLGAVDIMQDITAHRGVIDGLVKSSPSS